MKIEITIQLTEDSTHSIIKERPRHGRYYDHDGTDETIKSVDGVCGNYTVKEKPTEEIITKMAKIVFKEYCPVTKYHVWYAKNIECWRLTFGN